MIFDLDVDVNKATSARNTKYAEIDVIPRIPLYYIILYIILYYIILYYIILYYIILFYFIDFPKNIVQLGNTKVKRVSLKSKDTTRVINQSINQNLFSNININYISYII